MGTCPDAIPVGHPPANVSVAHNQRRREASTLHGMAIRFPDVEGSSLSMVPHRLPQTLAGDVNLLLIAFRQWQQRDVDTWTPLADELAVAYPQFRAYELPVISQAYRPVARFIDGGMRSGIPEPSVRDATITLYINRTAFMRSLQIPTASSIVPMLVQPSGPILWRTEGPRTTRSEDELRSVLTSHR